MAAVSRFGRVALRRHGAMVITAAISIAVVVAAACQESLTAPGACPEYCPGADIEVLDSVYVDAISRDSSFRGYVEPQYATAMQVVSEGDPAVSRAVLRFYPFGDAVVNNRGTREILAVDSFQLAVKLRYAPTTIAGLQLVLHRLPTTVDSSVTWDDIVDYIQDSTIVTVYDVSDSVRQGTLTIPIVPDSLLDFQGGERTASLGLVLRADSGGFVELGTTDGSEGANLTGFFEVDSSGTAVPSSDVRATAFDTYLTPPVAQPGPDVLTVGGIPSARSLLRVDVPDEVTQSAGVVRATLMLVPAEPVFAPPRDSLRIRAEAMSADVGAKSPILPSTDSLGRGTAIIPPASTDTVMLDITPLFGVWRSDSTFPRALMLRVLPEGSTVGEIRFRSSRSDGGRPSLRITYVPRTGGMQ